MYIRFTLLPILVFQLFTGLAQKDLEDTFHNFRMMKEYKNASIGMKVVEINSQETVFEWNADQLLIPASTMKLITSAAALEILGAEFRFKTRIGYQGRIRKNNILSGDLVIIGGGDPSLGSEYFKEYYYSPDFLDTWASEVKKSGISVIEGDLILDGSVYDSENVPATWIWEDIGNYYGAAASPFTIYDNLFRITFRSQRRAGSKTEIISIRPKTEGMEIINEVISSDSNQDMAYVFGSPLDKIRIVRGTIPANMKSFTIKAANHYPGELLAGDFIKRMAERGVFVKGRVRMKSIDKDKFRAIYIQESPQLDEIIKIMNGESINLFAEHLVRQLAVEKKGIGNRTAGIDIIMHFLNSAGVANDNIFMEDGSGLSHFNAVSPSSYVSLLSYMHEKSSERDAFIGSLPTAGSGTLYGFSTDYFPGSTLRAKSGSMTRVRGYAGYRTTSSGRLLAFAIMVNQFSGSHEKLRKEIEKLLIEIGMPSY